MIVRQLIGWAVFLSWAIWFAWAWGQPGWMPIIREVPWMFGTGVVVQSYYRAKGDQVPWRDFWYTAAALVAVVINRLLFY